MYNCKTCTYLDKSIKTKAKNIDACQYGCKKHGKTPGWDYKDRGLGNCGCCGWERKEARK